MFGKGKRMLYKVRYISQTTYYINVLKKEALEEDTILLESRGGKELTERILYLLKGLCADSFSKFAVYLAVESSKADVFGQMLVRSNIHNVHMVKTSSKKYRKHLATAKYLFNDTAFPSWFIKRNGQIYLNAWEIPKEKMERSTFNRAYILGNIGHNLQIADYLLCPDKEEKEEIITAYMLKNIWKGKLLLESSLQNDRSDSLEAAGRILRHVLLGEKCCEEEGAEPNGNQNILIYCSDFRPNGITTSLQNLLRLVDLKGTNYYFAFPEEQFAKNPERLDSIPDAVVLMPMSGNITEKTWAETLAFKLYFSMNIETKWVEKTLKQLFCREYQKRYGLVPLDGIVHFTGYAPYGTMLFLYAPVKKAIFAHNDMDEEIKEKGNQHLLTLKHAYRKYDKVVAISSAVKDALCKIEPNQENVVIVENPHDDLGVRKKAEQELKPDAETVISIGAERLQEILQDKKSKKFITIGRFSPEKGHKKLLHAFEQFAGQHPEVYLILIGGYGAFYQETVQYAASLACASRIVFVRAITNPFPILKRCDLFLLPSDREPFGLVLLEAATLKVPIVATDIPGSGDFMRDYHGYLVENSEKGLLLGMEAFMRREVKPLEISFEDYNRTIVKNFEKLFVE